MQTRDRNPDALEALRHRMSGLASGDLLRTMHLEFRKTIKAAGGDRAKAVQLGITRLLKAEIITRKDAGRLTSIAKRLMANEDAPVKAAVRESIEAAYYEMAGDRATSPTALAIAGGTVGALSLPVVSAGAHAVVARARNAGQHSGALIGATVGGFVGSVFGGGIGGGVGGALGAAIGAAVGSCFD